MNQFQVEVINTGSIDSDAFKGFIRLIGIEFENWKEKRYETEEEAGPSEFLL